ncbi:MAG: flavin reductase [bacterium]|nr:flavin reductase [bacterium]
MSGRLQKIDPTEIKDNLFKLIAKDWGLITAGNIDSFNTMTVSWGTFGELWNRKVCFAFVRPTRYTYEFTEQADLFTLSFFEESERAALKICGTKSGRDSDKVAEAGLIPVASEHGSVYFDQARLVLECRKIYLEDLKPTQFLDQSIDKEYPLKDYHRMYIGQILNCLKG